jgi:mannose-6-phosphate isomerase-like protein (cupin superfamily)
LSGQWKIATLRASTITHAAHAGFRQPLDRRDDRSPTGRSKVMFRKAFCSIAVTLSICSVANASDIHRVVTGLDANNKSTALFDSTLTLNAGASGIPSVNLWMTDSAPPGFSFTYDAALRKIGLNPPDNGTAIRVVDFPPINDAAIAKMDPNFMMKVVGDHAPARGVPVSNPMMHRTRTVDYAIIMSGEIDMMLDDKTVHVKAGDVVVQQATNHAWLNHGNEPCRVIFVLMDSKQP